MRSASSLYIGLVAVGPSVGLGHVVRMTAVLRALVQQDKQVCLLVEEREVSFKAQHYHLGDSSLLIRTCSEGGAMEVLSSMATEVDDSWTLLTDVPEASAFDYEAAHVLGASYTVCLNAYEPDTRGADLAFLRGYSWEAGEELPPNIRTGAQFESVAEQVRRLRPSVPWSGTEPKSVLITLGAADPGCLTEDVTKEALGLFDEVGVVVGPLFDRDREDAMQMLAVQGAVLHHVPSDLPALMLHTDLVVSLGGQTAYEAMCLGRPVAGVQWAAMARAVSFHARNGLLLDLGKREQVGAGLARVRSSPDMVRRIAAAGWERIDGKGAERMAAQVLTLEN